MPTLSKSIGAPGGTGAGRTGVAAIHLGPGPGAGCRGLWVVPGHGCGADGRNEEKQ